MTTDEALSFVSTRKQAVEDDRTQIVLDALADEAVRLRQNYNDAIQERNKAEEQRDEYCVKLSIVESERDEYRQRWDEECEAVQRGIRRENQGSKAIMDLQAERDELKRVVEKLQNKLNQLPKTTDGVPLVPGMVVYCVIGETVYESPVTLLSPTVDMVMTIHLPRHAMNASPDECYSTREAAEAAKESTP